MSRDPARGDLLIASPQLVDPNFRRSVVLICDHGGTGSLGLVVNRPMDVTLGKVIEPLGDHPVGEQRVYQGGPVESGRLLGIRRGEHESERAEDLGGGLFLLTDLQYSLDRIAEGAIDGSDYRFFLGYAGWGEGQLAGELKEEAWIVARATADLAFEVPVADRWAESLRRLGGRFELWAQMPVDPDWN